MAAGEPITVREFLKDLRVTAPVTLVALLALWALDVKGTRSLNPLAVVAFWAGFMIALGPLVWLRWNRLGDSSRRAWAWLGLSMLWAAAWVAAFVVVLAAFGV
jgi:hypothetical protein